jgi:2-oxoglutarate ferredoxin oxidoreductase subunit gamma
MTNATQTDTRTEIRLAGEGGQGMILAGIILAEAAAIYDGKQVVQSQSYGPEARGGASRAEVIISDAPIDFPEVLQADILVALSQEACDKYIGDLKEDSLLIVDVDNVRDVPREDAVRLPITNTSLETTGRVITSNTVALGILTALTGIVSKKAISKAVAARAPKGTKEINLKALDAGFKIAGGIKTGF